MILRNFQTQKSDDLVKPHTIVNLADVFRDNNDNYLNEYNLFLARFNYIPNFINEINIDGLKFSNWISEKYGHEIKDYYYCKIYRDQDNKAEFDSIFYFLYEDLLIYIDVQNARIRFLFKRTDISKIDEIISGSKKFKKRKLLLKPEISLLVSTNYGFDTRTFQINKPKLDIRDNYNDDFYHIHQTILLRLLKKNDKGLVLLHGKAGTGKTHYIRYLITSVRKKVIFLPPNVAEAITNPDLITILIDNPNCIFVIEDAENIIIDRDKNGISPVSALLNITDGLLSDCLNIQIICTFNTDITHIDNALMRRGRLIAKYEFKDLEVHKAQSLSNKLGFNTLINSPMSLTAIYNQEETDFQRIKKQNIIGFKITV